jgi:glycosyltransferase involved in cell wall biosynthesis
MKIAVMSYQTLFQSAGGLRMKVLKTVETLNRIGVAARLIDPVTERISDFDLLHVFAAFNGNHRLVQEANSLGIPVVVSPILMPPWTRWSAWKSRMLTRAIGRATRWTVTTSYDETRVALDGAQRLFALGQSERTLLMEAFLQDPQRISVVPNGVGDWFFEATPELFRERFQLKPPLVLHVGILGQMKNQLGLVRALNGLDASIALIGPCGAQRRDYLDACIREGGGRVHYLGEMKQDDPVLASAYAAADVFAVPSLSEGMSNSVLEALAAGTPVVTTKYHSCDFFTDPLAVAQIEPKDYKSIRAAVEGMLETRPSAERCRALVAELSWDKVAIQVRQHYCDVLDNFRRTAVADPVWSGHE